MDLDNKLILYLPAPIGFDPSIGETDMLDKYFPIQQHKMLIISRKNQIFFSSKLKQGIILLKIKKV